MVLVANMFASDSIKKYILHVDVDDNMSTCWAESGDQGDDTAYRSIALSSDYLAFLHTGYAISGKKRVELIPLGSGLLEEVQDDFVNRFYCRLSDTHLVWSQGSTNCHGDIWAHNLTTKETWNLTDHEADQFMPRIDGTRVVWTDNRNGPGGFVNADIYVHDFSTGDTTQLTDGEWIQMKPDISGNTVVFEDYRASADPNSQGSFDGMDIWMVDISTGAQTQLTSFPGPEGDPQIVGDKLYYYRQVPGETYFAVFEQDLTALGM